MKIASIMTKAFVSVSLDDNLLTIKNIFEYANFHHLLVVDNNQLSGVISDRDLLKALSPNIGTAAELARDLATLNKKAHQIVNRKLATLTAGASIFDAIDIFNQTKMSCIPIVDEKNHPVGIVTWRDIMRTLGERNAERNS
ncbi:MAG: CBS domain-containing protein [Alteromonadaceae bacterium]|jgi:acetoin utilization protein AcuB